MWHFIAKLSGICCALIAFGAGIPGEVVAQSTSRLIGRQATILEGAWMGNAGIEELSAASGTQNQSGLINLGNDGEWHWVRVQIPTSLEGGKYLEVATAQIDSLVALASCKGTLQYRMEAHGAGVLGSVLDGNFPAFPIAEQDCEDFAIYLGVKIRQAIESSIAHREAFNAARVELQA